MCQKTSQQHSFEFVKSFRNQIISKWVFLWHSSWLPLATSLNARIFQTTPVICFPLHIPTHHCALIFIHLSSFPLFAMWSYIALNSQPLHRILFSPLDPNLSCITVPPIHLFLWREATHPQSYLTDPQVGRLNCAPKDISTHNHRLWPFWN